MTDKESAYTKRGRVALEKGNYEKAKFFYKLAIKELEKRGI